MGCCGQSNLPGSHPTMPIVLGHADPASPVVYARITAAGSTLVAGLSSGDQRYFSGTGVIEALDTGMLMDVSAAAVRSGRQALRHEFLVVTAGMEPERFGVWKAAKERAAETGGHIEVVPVLEENNG